MRSVVFTALILLIGLVPVSDRAVAGVYVRVASESNGQIVIEITNPNPAVAPQTAFLVAIAPTGPYSTRFEIGPAAGLAPHATLDSVFVSEPFPFRGTRVLRVRSLIPQGVPAVHVTVDYTPAAEVRDAATVDPLLRETVINQSVFPIAPTTGSPDPWFSLASGWARLTVPSRGVYAVTGADLAASGVALAGIDPATLRLYSSGAIMQARSLSDPDGSWRHGKAMREVPVRVEAGSDGTFDPADRVIFYGVATQDWADYYGPAADTVYYEHERAGTNVYFLAWGGSLPGSPARIGDLPSAPIAAPDRTTYEHREYREKDLIEDFDFRGDGWLWLDIGKTDFKTYQLATVTVSNLVASRPQTFRTLALARYIVSGNNLRHHAVYGAARGGQSVSVGQWVWDAAPGDLHYEDGRPVLIQSNFLANGSNVFTLRAPHDLNTQDQMQFAWFSVWYERRIIASQGAVGFDSPDTTGTVNFRADGLPQAGTLYAFDVTDPWAPLALTGLDVASSGGGRRVRFSSAVNGGRRHFWVLEGSAFRTPGIDRFTPVDLRADPVGPNMLIICHSNFRAAAERLRAYRAGRLTMYPNPVVRVVTVDQIFDNYSAGLPDPMAIRNYIKYLYDNFPDANGNPALGYVVLFGDATDDFRNHISQRPDYVPTNLYFTREAPFTYSTDEWYGHLDVSDQIPGHGILDVALGRLPAESAAEADAVVDKIIGYETGAPRESWRNDVVLVADDEISSFEGQCEHQWTDESETIAREHAPEFTTIHKIYLTEYPSIGKVKPLSRLDFLEKWNAGALIINYIGHGSSNQMADEQVFLGTDVSLLDNGLKLPLLAAFSCTIGDFSNPSSKSLSEKLLFRVGGGVIATVTAARESYPNPNEKVDYALFDQLLPRRPSDDVPPVGVALLRAKNWAQAEVAFSTFQEDNNWKYNLLGDPSMQLQAPRQEIHFETGVADTLTAGARESLRGTVLKNGVRDTAFNGTVDVTVREPVVRRSYVTRCASGYVMKYLVPGGVMYRGTADVRNGEFAVSFRVPRYASTGTLAFAGAYASSGSADAAAAVDSVLSVVAPTLSDSLALRPIDGAPRVTLGFKSGLTTVKPGDTVRGLVRDRDGINILSTTNEGKQAILIDRVPLPIDVNEYFSFDHGGVDTSGVLLYPLPSLDVGRHRLVYKVSDSFGSTTLDTLAFNVTDPSDFYAEAVFNYPNPFATSTQFFFRVSNRATIHLELYTVSGKRVRRLGQVHDGGQVWIEWDGRDEAGDEVANGTYLYVATIDFTGLERAPVVLRGKLSKIR